MLKIKNILSISIIFVLLFSLFSINGFSIDKIDNEIGEFSTDEEFSYYNIDSTVWSELENHQEKVEMCQLDTEQLQTMSTEDLVSACLDYPLLIDMFAYNSVEEGFNALLNQSNAFYELTQRSDAATKLLNTYDKCYIVTMEDFKTTSKENTKELYNDMFETNVVEALLSQEVFINKLSNQEKVSLARIANKKLEQKLGESDVFSKSSISLSTSILNNDSISAVTTDDYYDGYFYFGNGIYGYYNKIVKTPRGSKVSALDVQQDFTSAEVRAYTALVGLSYPKVTLMNLPTIKYNCHSYAWHSTSGEYWINDPTPYIRDGSYFRCIKKSGAKMIYKNDGQIDHSGIVDKFYQGPYKNSESEMITVKSKWGALGLYNHSGLDCPYYLGSNTIIKCYSSADYK